jgi:hypothetical protein
MADEDWYHGSGVLEMAGGVEAAAAYRSRLAASGKIMVVVTVPEDCTGSVRVARLNRLDSAEQGFRRVPFTFAPTVRGGDELTLFLDGQQR